MLNVPEVDIFVLSRYRQKSAHRIYANLGGTTEIQGVFVLVWTEPLFCTHFRAMGTS